jgi:hypothetical protein
LNLLIVFDDENDRQLDHKLPQESSMRERRPGSMVPHKSSKVNISWNKARPALLRVRKMEETQNGGKRGKSDLSSAAG